MIEKLSKYNNAFNFSHVEIEALNKPQGPGWELFSGEQELSIDRMRVVKLASKKASLDKSKDVDLNDFDIEAAVKEHPDHLFVKVFAIKKDEVNDNGDAFSEGELKKAAHTFIGCPIFCNHQNDDIEKSRGNVVHAWYDDEKGGIMIVARVDKVAYPKLARGIEEGYINGTSMGCQVHHSLCSICHNKAHTADEYCSHVKERKTKKHSGKVKCSFHKSKCKPDEDCPLCGTEKGGSKDIEHKEAQVYEWNYGLKFIEDSFVVNPACHDCLVECILNVPEYTKKVAQIKDKMEKIAREQAAEKLTKIAGKVEIDLLNKAMKFMEVVAKSMMDQKDQVSMEYVSDIVDVMAKSQTVTDELIEMGYGQLQSPSTLQNPDAVGDAVMVGSQQGQQTSPQEMQPSQQPQQPTGATTSPASNGIGSVTKPSFASSDKKIKEFEKTGSYLKERITSLVDTVDRYNGQQVDFSGIITEINKVADSINTVKESGNTMSKDTNEKTAAGSGLSQDSLQVTTEKQLANAKLEDWAGNRQNKEINTVTEGSEQLGGSGAPNDTTTDSPQQRKNEYANYTTELQLEKDMKEAEVTRWNDYPEVITEKQWEAFNRAVGAVLSEDQHDHTTQAQLEDLRKNHRWVEPNFTTENQLKDTTNWLSTDNAWLSKEASASYAKALVQASVDALSDAIAFYKRTPAEIVKAAKFITRDPHAQIKAAFITLINGMPKKASKRKAAIARMAYFNSDSNVSAQDALLACMGDHCKNLKAEDFVEAVRSIAASAEKMLVVESTSKKKLASAVSADSEVVVDKTAAFEEAFKSLTGVEKSASAPETVKEASAEDDGLFQVRAEISEIQADISDRDAFTRAAEKFAQSHIGRQDAVLYSIEVDEELGAVLTTLKEASKLTAEETANYEKYASQQRVSKRDGLVREAQMMGGEQPAMGGAPGGQGATMPQPPAGGAGQPPAPPQETLDGSDEAAAEDVDGGGEKPLPPGSLCPVCGTQDVDVVAGKGKCNNPECGSEFVFKVNIEVTKYKGVTDNGDDDESTGDENDGAPLDGDTGAQEGEGFAMPDAAESPNTPIAAMTRLTPERIQKFAQKEGWQLGRISPLTGSMNTVQTGTTADGAPKYLCMDSGATYSVRTAYAKGDPKNLYVEWRWLPKVAGTECGSCKRAKAAWTKALKSAGMTDAEFDALSLKAQADKVLEMKSAGHFAAVKTASKSGNVVAEYKKAYSVQGTFPYESCVQKIANRYGENAIALSGPNKGENLAECVCKQLKSASVYADRLAVKIADTWKDKDACIECMEDFVRIGYDMEKAATVCQHLKVKFASSEELFAEAMGDPMMNQPAPQGMGGGMGAPAPAAPAPAPQMGGGMGAEDVDPFADPALDNGQNALSVDVQPGADNGMMEVDLGGDLAGDINVDQNGSGNGQSVSIELPLEAVQALDTALDMVLGPEHDQDNVGLGDNSDLGNLAPDDESKDSDEGDFGGDSESSDNDKDGDDDFGGDGNVPDFDGDNDDDGGNGNNKEPSVDNDKEIKEGDESDRFAQYMRRGKQNRVGEINLDVSSILAAMNKKAGEVEPKQEGSQDVVDNYSAGDGSVQGNEKKFDADKPDVPRSQATIGKEPSDLNPKDKPLPKVPKAGGQEGNLEGEKNYKAESGVNLSGGLAGAGKTETASAKKTKKTAGEKKVDAEPVSDVVEVEIDFSDNKDLSSTPDFMKRTPFEESDRKEINNIPERGEGSFIGDEKNSIEFVPKFPNKAPSIPTGDGYLSKEKNEKNKPELTEKVKGFVAANSEKSQQIEVEAQRIAVRMLKAALIEDTELMNKVAELRRYDIPQLKDIENAIFKAAKGLTTEPDGVGHQPVPVISEASNQRSGEIKDALQSLFSLDQRNKIASELTDENLRKAHGR